MNPSFLLKLCSSSYYQLPNNIQRFILNQRKLNFIGIERRVPIIQFSSSIKQYKKEAIDELEEPLKFSTSKAAIWKSENLFVTPQQTQKRPKCERWVILASIAAFLIYFGALREENDIDLMLSKSLYDHVEGLEEQQLLLCLKHYRDTGKDTTAIERRLGEINLLKERIKEESMISKEN